MDNNVVNHYDDRPHAEQLSEPELKDGFYYVNKNEIDGQTQPFVQASGIYISKVMKKSVKPSLKDGEYIVQCKLVGLLTKSLEYDSVCRLESADLCKLLELQKLFNFQNIKEVDVIFMDKKELSYLVEKYSSIKISKSWFREREPEPDANNKENLVFFDFLSLAKNGEYVPVAQLNARNSSSRPGCFEFNIKQVDLRRTIFRFTKGPDADSFQVRLLHPKDMEVKPKESSSEAKK